MHVAAPALGPAWLDPQTILDALGPWALWGALAIVFAECGLLIGFLLPGDSLLFTVGLLVSTGVIEQPLWLACLVLTVAAFAGNVVGYEIGRRGGPAIFRREDSRLFKKEYVDKTVAFFDKYGTQAIVLARFVPIVRTFITVTAGVGRMDRRRFLTYSGIGGTLWAAGVTILGALLGQFAFVRNNIETMLLAIVLVSVVPIGVEFLRERAKARRAGDRTESASPGDQTGAVGIHPIDGSGVGPRPEWNGTQPEWNGTQPDQNGTQPDQNGTQPDRSGALLEWGGATSTRSGPAGGGRHVS